MYHFLHLQEDLLVLVVLETVMGEETENMEGVMRETTTGVSTMVAVDITEDITMTDGALTKTIEGKTEVIMEEENEGEEEAMIETQRGGDTTRTMTSNPDSDLSLPESEIVLPPLQPWPVILKA